MTMSLDFSGGPVVKNPPANAGDTGSIPGAGRSHMLQLSLCPTTAEPALQGPQLQPLNPEHVKHMLHSSERHMHCN